MTWEIFTGILIGFAWGVIYSEIAQGVAKEREAEREVRAREKAKRESEARGKPMYVWERPDGTLDFHVPRRPGTLGYEESKALIRSLQEPKEGGAE